MVTTSNFRARRSLPRTDCTATGSCRPSSSSRTSSRWSTSMPAPTTGQQTLQDVELYHAPLGAGGRRGDGKRPSSAWPKRRDEEPGAEDRAPRDPRPAPRRRRGLVRLQVCSAAGPRSQNDYLEIATQFHTDAAVRGAADVAAPTPRKRAASPGSSTCSTTAESSWSISAEVEPEALYTEGPHGRTSSRAPRRACARCARPSSWPRRSRIVDTSLT